MQAVDSEVLKQVLAWLAAGRGCWLASVVATWGSSPRPVGSLMAVSESGEPVGSLSGGCVEDDLIERLLSGEIAARTPQYYEYGVTPEETERLGLPCGGHLDVMVEPLRPTPGTLAHFADINAELERRRSLIRTLDVRSGACSFAGGSSSQSLSYDPDQGLLRQTFGPRRQLFIIGAGMVSQYLASMAQTLDFLVRVCDPREHLLQGFNVPGVETVCEMPDDAIRRLASDPGSAIVALTHDPRIDDMGLLEALQTDAFYIGAMGSRRTSQNRRERLLQLEVTPAQLKRLRAPIGIAIGSKTPPEIAIAILAELIAVSHGVSTAARTEAAPVQSAV